MLNTPSGLGSGDRGGQFTGGRSEVQGRGHGSQEARGGEHGRKEGRVEILGYSEGGLRKRHQNDRNDRHGR